VSHFRRFRRTSATEPPALPRRHARPAEAPQPPHAAPVSAPTDAFAGIHRYDSGTIPGLRAHAARCTEKAEEAEREANRLLGQAAHLRVQAADHLRIAGLAELDAQTPPDAMWPLPAPQVPAPAAPIVHFSDNVNFWPPCGEREGATWSSENPADVTCQACLGVLAERRQQSPDEEPRADWAPAASQDGDTERLPRVRTCIAGTYRDGVVYHCTRVEGHDGGGDATLHYSPVIGEFSADPAAASL